MRLLCVFLVLPLCLTAPVASAGTLAEYHFETEEQTREFRALTEQLRCLVCQNESLAGSNAELAQDLRREIYEMMRGGQTKDQIVEFMVARYGDFVLYKPPLKPSTYPLWFGPLLLLLIAAFVLYRALARKRVAPETQLSDEESRRVARLLEERPGAQAQEAKK